MARLTSFLQTTTGLITAVTTLLVAVVGLVTAFSQLRGEDDDPPPASITTVLGGDSAAETELRSYVPAAVRSSCGAPKDAEEGAIAAFNCTYREVVNVQYNLFASHSDLEAGVESVESRYGDRHECGSEPLLCFVGDDGVASIVWVDEDADVLAFAWRDDGNLDALYESWPRVKA